MRFRLPSRPHGLVSVLLSASIARKLVLRLLRALPLTISGETFPGFARRLCGISQLDLHSFSSFIDMVCILYLTLPEMPSHRQIAKDWGVNPAYVDKQVKKGCPTDSFEAAREWRLANQKRAW